MHQSKLNFQSEANVNLKSKKMRLRRDTTLGRLYQDGDVIIRKGEHGDCVYVIQEGQVEVIDHKEDTEVKLAVLNNADFFGEMGLFEKDVRSCTVRAIGDVRVMTIDKKNFYQTIQKDPTVAYRLLERMSKRLRETNKRLV